MYVRMFIYEKSCTPLLQASLAAARAQIQTISSDRERPPVSGSDVDPTGNFPFITDKHRSLAVKALKNDPSLYAKYCNVKTPKGFTVSGVFLFSFSNILRLRCRC